MTIKINLYIFLFLILFLFTSQIDIYVLIMIFAFIHELGHLFSGIILGFKVEALKVMPLGFNIEFRTNILDYNRKILKSNILVFKKLLINISGPLVNVFIIIISKVMNFNANIIYSNLLILVINLIPIYPLDGGKIIKNSLKLFIGNKKANIYTNIISNIFVIVISLFSSIAIYYYKNIAFLFGISFIWMLIIKENKRQNTYIKIYKIIDNQRKNI